jgi:segregation and condensation protein B
MTDLQQIKRILEGAILAAGKPLPLERLEALFLEGEKPEAGQLQAALDEIAQDCAERGFELKKVASGYRFQVRQELSEWISRLWEEKPQRYSRALMETLSIIAYRQPITRGDIEKIRGVAVSTQIVQTLLEHEWVRVVGHRDVPGRPAMYATTKQFLDYFNLESLEQLPPLSEIRDLEEINRGLALEEDKPAGRIIEFPDPGEGEQDLVVDEEAEKAAEIGLRPISEILSMVDSQLGISPVLDELEAAAGEQGDSAAADAAAGDGAAEISGSDAAEPEDDSTCAEAAAADANPDESAPDDPDSPASGQPPG